MLGSFVALIGIGCAVLASQVSPDQQPLLLIASALAVMLAGLRKGRPSLLLLAILCLAYLAVSLPGGLTHLVPQWYLRPGQLHPEIRHWFFAAVPVICALFYWLSCRRQSGGLPLALVETSEDIARLLALAGIGSALALLGLGAIVATDLLAPWLSGHSAFREIFVGDQLPARLSVWQPLLLQSHLVALFPVALLGLFHSLGGRVRPLVWFHASGPRQVGLALMTIGLLIASAMIWLLASYGWDGVRNLYLAQAWRNSTHLVLDFADRPDLTRLVILFQDPWLTRSLKLLFVFAALCALSTILRSLVLLTGPVYLERRAACSIGRYARRKRSAPASVSEVG